METAGLRPGLEALQVSRPFDDQMAQPYPLVPS
jgi:hypothetical protein